MGGDQGSVAAFPQVSGGKARPLDATSSGLAWSAEVGEVERAGGRGAWRSRPCSLGQGSFSRSEGYSSSWNLGSPVSVVSLGSARIRLLHS